MIPLLMAAAFAAVPARAAAPLGHARTYGVLILAYDVNVAWRRELGSLRGLLKGRPVESVARADDAVSVQRALDLLVAQRVSKIVAVPIETISGSPRLEQTRCLFEPNACPSSDRSPKPFHPARKSALAPLHLHDEAKILRSSVPLALAPALDQSPLLVAILADRAKALTKTPARESLVLAGVAPRSDAALKAWKTAAQSIADQVGAKAGFRKAVAVAVRDGVSSDRQNKDRAELQKTFRGLIREGRVTAVPLSPEAGRVEELLKKALGGFYAYRWNGQGIQGDSRLADWIKASAETAAAMPDGRKINGEKR